ncbi:hypothetical protein Ddc_02607 [Ditylenchus destructor]|nr:hypothetical protein Ddc_02607 [Ditylenchus destructor]
MAVGLVTEGVPLKGATHPPEPALFKDGGKRFYSPEPLKSIPKDFKEHPERNLNKLSDDISYDEFDVLISDINEEELVKIGKMRGIENLSSGSFSSPAFPVNGKVHGLNIRYMIPLVCQRAGIPNSRAIQIWFLVDTSSPYTCLTSKSLEAIFGRNVTNDLYELAIQDQTSKIECQVSKAHFEEVNILGADAMLLLDLSIQVDWKNREFQLVKS